MADKMNRQAMIKLLHELDKQLNTTLEIDICGASCAILNHNLERTSTDIDVMRSSVPFTTKSILKAIHAVALHNSTGQHWINDQSKEVFKHIPEDYKPDTTPITGEDFKLLKARVISRADFVITKLAYYSNIRQWDISDIKNLKLSENDLKLIYKKIDTIAKKRQYDALMIEGNFKAIRSALVKDENGFSYSNGCEIAKYCLKRYGTQTSDNNISMWQEGLDNITVKAGTIIAKIDLDAANMLKTNNIIVENDKKYRNSREKRVDHGLDF